MRTIIRMSLLVWLLQLNACGMKSYVLLDGRTEVPIDTSVYKNKNKFDTYLLSIVDTSVIYEEYNLRNNILSRLDNDVASRIYSAYRFYANGCVNGFYWDRIDEPLAKIHLDPLYNGRRGIFYQEGGKIRFDLFAEANQQRDLGKLSSTITFSGDTMYRKRDDLSYTQIYIKRKLPKEYFKFKADW